MSEHKETTIYDIAGALKISPATVSRGLKDHPGISKKTKKLINETARRMGYRSNMFASNLRRNKTNTLGVIVPRLNSTFMSDVMAGMEKVANETGYNLIISQSLESEKKEILNVATMFTSRVDGLLVSLAYDTHDLSHFDPFFEKNIPVIFFDRVVENEKYSTIAIDNFKAAYDITSHLIGQGCTRPAHITGNLLRNVYSERYRGFLQALAHYHLSFREEYLVTCNLSQQDGMNAAKRLLQLPEHPDCIFLTNDLCAAACMFELKKAGKKIPEDIAVAGFNNDPVSALVEPNLTTVHYHGFEMGEMAIQNMINYLNGSKHSNLTQSIVMRHEIMIRQSSLRKT